MENDELLIKIKEQVKKEKGINSVFTEGDGTEYGVPDRLEFSDSRYGKYFTLDAKIGSSWYMSGCQGVRLLGLSFKSHPRVQWADFQYKLVDVTGDYNTTIWPWFKYHFNEPSLDESLNNRVCMIQDLLTKGNLKSKTSKFSNYHRLFWKVWAFPNKIYPRSPKIQYRFEDVDEGYEFRVIDMVLYPLTANPKEEKTSLIIQVRKDLYDNHETLMYTIRRFTTADPPVLLSIEKEKEVGQLDLEDIIWDFYKSELEKFIEKENDPNLVEKAKELLKE